MPPIENSGNKEHKHRIQQIKVNFLRLKLSLTAPDVLNNTEDGTDHNQRADTVEDEDVGLPWYKEGFAASCRAESDATVEESCGDDEEAKDDELNEETGDEDGVCAVFGCFGFGSGDHATA